MATAALRIAYQNNDGDWASVQPDFLIVSRRDDGSLGISIIDPHTDHLADAKNQLSGRLICRTAPSEKCLQASPAPRSALYESEPSLPYT